MQDMHAAYARAQADFAAMHLLLRRALCPRKEVRL
jgi:hypothetical protein